MPITPTRLEAMSHASLYAPTSRTENNADSDSLPAYREGGAHETNFRPVTAAEFLATAPEDEAVDWILDDYLPTGGLVVLAGKPKEGKTTLSYELAVKVAKGLPFLNRQTRLAGVLILGLEEHPRDMKIRLRNLGAEGLTNLHVYSHQLNPTLNTFNEIKRYSLEYGIQLILVDTLGAFWNVRDENDAAEVTKAMKPFLALARETGACVILIHHARKSEGANGDEIRGSGALFAAVDVALILKRHDVQMQRTLRAISRYHDTPPELVLDLTESGYSALGDPAAANRQVKREKVKAGLTEELQGAQAIAKKVGVPSRDIYRLLNELYDKKEAHREGAGRKGDPYLYRLNSMHATPPDIGGTPHATNVRQRAFDACDPPCPRTKVNPAPETEEEINLVD